MFGFLKKKPLSPELQKVYDRELKVRMAEHQKACIEAQVEKVKARAAQDALDKSTPNSLKVMHGLVTVGKRLNKAGKRLDTEKFDAFVLGDKAKKGK
jgi:hydroxymethylpyrimidine pyrophosphatase-like HAD family hydrolase